MCRVVCNLPIKNLSYIHRQDRRSLCPTNHLYPKIPLWAERNPLFLRDGGDFSPSSICRAISSKCISEALVSLYRRSLIRSPPRLRQSQLPKVDFHQRPTGSWGAKSLTKRSTQTGSPATSAEVVVGVDQDVADKLDVGVGIKWRSDGGSALPACCLPFTHSLSLPFRYALISFVPKAP
jgi:hypothetical protein